MFCSDTFMTQGHYYQALIRECDENTDLDLILSLYVSGYNLYLEILNTQLFEKTSSRNVKLKFLAFNMQWLFGSILEPTTKIIFLDTFCSQDLRIFSGGRLYARVAKL